MEEYKHKGLTDKNQKKSVKILTICVICVQKNNKQV